MSTSASLKSELKKLRLEVEHLKQVRQPNRWIELIDAPQDKIQQALEMGFNVIETINITAPDLVLDPDEPLPAEYKVIAADTAARHAAEAAEAAKAPAEVKRIRLIPADNPNKLKYPKQVY